MSAVNTEQNHSWSKKAAQFEVVRYSAEAGKKFLEMVFMNKTNDKKIGEWNILIPIISKHTPRGRRGSPRGRSQGLV